MTAEPVSRQGSVQGEYVAVIYPGHNTSGLIVYGIHVLIRCDPFAPVTIGGVHFTDQEVEKRTLSSETGCIYAMGEGAFSHYQNGRAWSSDKPKVGDRVFFQRYQGVVAEGKDGNLYRIMEYDYVAAGLDGDGVIPGENTAAYGKGDGPGFS